MNDLAENPVARRDRVAGLDTLKIAALVLITWQHAASVLGAYAETQWRGISPGQTGVAVFCAISGYLGFRLVPHNELAWFRRRLLSVFPSYWIATVAAFVMAIAWGSGKPVTLGLFVSQMLGLGYFTHGWELINVVSWFLSLILLCYALSLAAWRTGQPIAFWWFVAILTIVLVATRNQVDLSRHVLAFAFGALCARGQLGHSGIVIAIAMIGFGVMVDPQFFYAGISLVLLRLAVVGRVPEPTWIGNAARYSYEYFLVHGICLVAATKLIPNGFVAVPLAVLAACLAAVVLHRLEESISIRLARGRRQSE